MKSKKIWTFIHRSNLRWIAYMVAIVSLIFAWFCYQIEEVPFGLVVAPVIIAFAFIFGNKGTDISLSKNKIRHFLAFGKLKIGRWESIGPYTDIIILRQKKSYVEYADHATKLIELKRSFYDYEIYLASPNHYNLFMVCKFENQESAYKTARRLALQLDREWVAYNPGKQYLRKVLA